MANFAQIFLLFNLSFKKSQMWLSTMPEVMQIMSILKTEMCREFLDL